MSTFKRKRLDPLVALMVQSAPKNPVPQPRVRAFNNNAKYWAPQVPSQITPLPYVQSSYVNLTYVSNTN